MNDIDPEPRSVMPAAPSSAPGAEEAIQFNWRTNAILFLLTVASVFFVGRTWTGQEGDTELELWLGAWQFGVPLLAILVAHELGHWVAARIHKVDASLPFFIPMPAKIQ